MPDEEIEMNKELIVQQISLMGYVEGICEEHHLVPPVEVSVACGRNESFEFDYTPESEEVEFPIVPLPLPLTLRLADAAGRSVEAVLSDLTPPPEWLKRFSQ